MPSEKNLEDFACEEIPLHCSQLPNLVSCNWREVSLFLDLLQDSESEPANTGSAVHKAISAWHETGDAAKALEIMRKGLPKYPLADLEQAAEWFLSYQGDTDNKNANIFAIEQEYKWPISPSSRDHTQKSIWLTGTFDQIRVHPDGELYIWDVKSGKPTGEDMLQDHLLQVCAYALGATIKYNRPVHPGGIIRLRAYTARKHKQIMHSYGLRIDHCNTILDSVRNIVAMVRAGEVFPQPSKDCYFCKYLRPENCIQELIELGSVNDG